MNEDYKPNSHRFKESNEEAKNEKKKVEKIIKGTAKTKKKTEIGKLKNALISDDVANIKSYVVLDVLIPAFKKAISDIVTDGIAMILYGESGRRSKNSPSKIPYYSFNQKDSDRFNTNSQIYNYNDVILDNRGEADAVLEQMVEMIESYGVVSVADMYDLVGVTGNYTDNKYGWTSLRSAEPIRVREGYKLKLPLARPIN